MESKDLNLARPDAKPEAATTPTRPTVVVNNLTKVFYDESRGALRAVDGIDFECHPGRIFEIGRAYV